MSGERLVRGRGSGCRSSSVPRCCGPSGRRGIRSRYSRPLRNFGSRGNHREMERFRSNPMVHNGDRPSSTTRKSEPKLRECGTEGVNDHAQRAWLWPAPQSGALDVGKAPLGPCVSSELPAGAVCVGKAPLRLVSISVEQLALLLISIFLSHYFRQPNRAFPGGRSVLHSTALRTGRAS